MADLGVDANDAAAPSPTPVRVALGHDAVMGSWVRHRAAGLVEDIRRVWHFRWLLYYLVVSCFKVRYQRSMIGFFWTVLNPALNLAVLALIFTQIVGRESSNYTLYLFSGMLPYNAFSELVSMGSMSLISREGYLRTTNVPKLLFPLECVGIAFFNFLFSMAALFTVLILLGAPVYIQLVMLPATMALLFTFSLGFMLICMTLTTYFRDFGHILEVGLRAFYFMCPIITFPDQMGKLRWIMDYNPIGAIIEIFHDVFYYGRWPSLEQWGVSWAGAGLLVTVGYLVYKRYEHDYIYRL